MENIGIWKGSSPHRAHPFSRFNVSYPKKDQKAERKWNNVIPFPCTSRERELNNSSSSQRFSYGSPQTFLIVVFLCTRSSAVKSLLLDGLHDCTKYPKWSLTSATYNERITRELLTGYVPSDETRGSVTFSHRACENLSSLSIVTVDSTPHSPHRFPLRQYFK